ncbi:transcriptional regulator [Erythrobacter sp. YT30]|nr:transcriptional regulator [Erythrobacter sp. YT30]
MDVNITLVAEAVSSARLANKHQVIDKLAELLAEVYDLKAEEISEGLEQREALGSTGFGKGIAIPHCRSADVRRPTLAVLKLEEPIDFGAADAMPVSLFFALVSPENAGATHLHALAAISRITRDDSRLQKMHDAPDGDALFAILTNQFLRDAA